MSYLELINRFWLLHEEHAFSNGAVALYFYLLKVNNSLAWKASFKRINAKVQADLSIHRKKLLEVKKELSNAGLIDFTTSKTNGNVTYTIVGTDLHPKEVTKEVAKVVSSDNPKEVTKEVAKVVSNDNPKEVTKEVTKVVAKMVSKDNPKGVSKEVANVVARKIDKEEDKDIDKKKEIKNELSFFQKPLDSNSSLSKSKAKKKVAQKKKVVTNLENEWASIMNRFIEHRLLLGNPIKTPQGMAAREKKLLTISGGNLQVAKNILNQTIENEWKDFYPLKNNGNENYRSTGSTNQPIINAESNHSEAEAL